MLVLWLSVAAALTAIAVGFVLMRGVLATDQGTPKMIEIALAIQVGAAAYLRRQFKTIAVIMIPVAAIVFLTSTKIVEPDGVVALTQGPVGSVPNAGVHRRRVPVRAHRLHRHDAGHPWQRAHRRGSQVRIASRRAQGRIPHRRCRRHVHRGPRSARRHGHHPDVPEHQLGHPGRLRLRWLADRPVPASRWRHLHQGGRRRRRPRRQGRSGHPRRRPAQPGDDRRQRGRQRRRLRRHGRRPVRVATRSPSSPRSSSACRPSPPSAPTPPSAWSSRSLPVPSA